MSSNRKTLIADAAIALSAFARALDMADLEADAQALSGGGQPPALARFVDRLVPRPDFAHFVCNLGAFLYAIWCTPRLSAPKHGA